MERDTDIGGAGGRFPETRRSAVIATRSRDPEERRRAFSTLVAGYWKPIYKYVRIKWRSTNEEAKDLTQEFFARAMEKDWFQRYDPAQASFRAYLRTCLDHFVANQRQAQTRLKRGGPEPTLSLDFELAEGELRRHEVAADVDLDAYFHHEWVRSLFGLAVEALREHCEASGKATQFALFRRYDLEADEGRTGLTYEALAQELDLPVTQVTNYLAWARREFRRIVLEKLREISGSEAEYRAEAKALLGVDAS